MTQQEAIQLLRAFESGYVDPHTHEAALRQAERITGKNFTVRTYESISNPEARVSIRIVGVARKVRTQSDYGGPFAAAAWVGKKTFRPFRT